MVIYGDLFPSVEEEIRFRASGIPESAGSIELAPNVRVHLPRDLDDAELFLDRLGHAVEDGKSVVRARRMREEQDAAVAEAASIVHPDEEIVGEIS